MSYRRVFSVATVPVAVVMAAMLACTPPARADAVRTRTEEGREAVRATDVSIANGPRNTLNVSVTSWRDIPFKTVERQAYDFSCGSAAVATLLTYGYGQPVSEAEVFRAMFTGGDQAAIRREGFSMADIRAYLLTRGLQADGYRLPLDEVEKQRIPFIALINAGGYHHFVVVKSIRGDAVLVGDSRRGNMVYRRSEFLDKWNGIALIVKNQARHGRSLFMSDDEWRWARTLMRPSLRTAEAIDRARFDPAPWQMDRAGIDISETVLSTTGQIGSTATGLAGSATGGP